MLVLGQPAKTVRRLSSAESIKIKDQVAELYAKALEYRKLNAGGDYSSEINDEPWCRLKWVAAYFSSFH